MVHAFFAQITGRSRTIERNVSLLNVTKERSLLRMANVSIAQISISFHLIEKLALSQDAKMEMNLIEMEFASNCGNVLTLGTMSYHATNVLVAMNTLTVNVKSGSAKSTDALNALMTEMFAPNVKEEKLDGSSTMANVITRALTVTVRIAQISKITVTSASMTSFSSEEVTVPASQNTSKSTGRRHRKSHVRREVSSQCTRTT